MRLTVFLLAATAAFLSPDLLAQPAEKIGRIEAATPDKPRFAPRAPRKVLVFSLPKKSVHTSIPYGERMLQIAARKTGAFEVVLSKDPDMFRPENLKQFDAIFLNNASGDLTSDTQLRESLLQFVRDGKGLAGIHAATTCFPDWPEFASMIGGRFDGHPWSAKDTFTLKVELPGHPVAQAFASTSSITLTDELYQFKEPDMRTGKTVLVSMDTTRTDMDKKGITRQDNDFPISWVKTYGKGKVFYCSLGHNHHHFWDPMLIQHWLDGIQFVLGDLPIDKETSQ